MTTEVVLAGLAAGLATLLLARPSPRLSSTRSGGLLLAVVPVVAVGVLLVAMGSTVAAVLVVAGAGVAGGVRSLLDVRRRRAEAAAVAERVLECCELISSELVAGVSPVVALRRAAAEWPALAPVAEAGELGGDPAVALADLGRTPGAGDLRLVAAAWSVAHRTGGGLADALDRMAGAIRDRRATTRVVESELASARATARLVAALPFALLLLGGGSGAWTFLFGHPAGVACLAVGLLLLLCGLWWIERIAQGVTR